MTRLFKPKTFPAGGATAYVFCDIIVANLVVLCKAV